MAVFGPTLDEVMEASRRKPDDESGELLSTLVRDALEVELDRVLRGAHPADLDERVAERGEEVEPPLVHRIERMVDTLDDLEAAVRDSVAVIDHLLDSRGEPSVVRSVGPPPSSPRPAAPPEPARSVPPAPPDSSVVVSAPASGSSWALVARVLGVLVAVAVTATALALSWDTEEDTPSQEVASGADEAESGEAIDQAAPASPVTLLSPGKSIDFYLDEPSIHLVAHAGVPALEVHERPIDANVQRRLPNPTETGGPLVVLVRERRGDWLRVDLPVRPNGSQGWVHRDHVRLTTHTYRIEVSVGERNFRLFRGDEVVMESAVAIGAQDTPTPGGSFYIKELLQPPNPNSVYGPYAFGLSGFSNVLEDFAGGQGVIGIHGTDDPDAIGNEVSHGCIRLPNDQITELVGVLPLGTPVHIIA